MYLKIYSDGASRGNPGISSIAFLVLDEKGKVIKSHSEYIGVKTNNQAEYEALITALMFTSKINTDEVTCFTDSELIAKQLNGEYRVNNPVLLKLWSKIQQLKKNFSNISFIHVPRTNRFIQKVDKMAHTLPTNKIKIVTSQRKETLQKREK